MIPFNKPSFSSQDVANLQQAIEGGHSSGNGPFTRRAEKLLEGIQGSGTALLTTSCTHALELSARLLDLQPGDEVIVPSYTFVSTASAFMWNGARPVFADIDAATQNIDFQSVENLISERTRAICIVHYAGIGASPDRFQHLAQKHGLTLIEDNAHGLGATFKGRQLGSFGAISTLSFHETKNITCGEGGAIVINDPSLVERAEILREKGTDRSRFLRGQVDKYSWIDTGSSWVLSDLLAGLLTGQLERISDINQRRLDIWNSYNGALRQWAMKLDISTPTVPPEAKHTGHMYYLKLPTMNLRDQFIEYMKLRGVTTVFHYQSLHNSRVGMLLGEDKRQCLNSDQASETLVRLPLFSSLDDSQLEYIIDSCAGFAT